MISVAVIVIALIGSVVAGPVCTPQDEYQFCCNNILFRDLTRTRTCCGTEVCTIDEYNAQQVANNNNVVYVVQAITTPEPPTTQADNWQPVWGPIVYMPPAETEPPTTTTAVPEVYCNGYSITALQRMQPNLMCCGNKVVYDSQYYTCKISQVQPVTRAATTTTMRPIRVVTTTKPTVQTLPFVPIFCQNAVYYVDPNIASNYKCCVQLAYDSRTESCMQGFRVTYQPTSTYRVSPIDPTVAPQRAVLSCPTGKYIFASAATASSYTC